WCAHVTTASATLSAFPPERYLHAEATIAFGTVAHATEAEFDVCVHTGIEGQATEILLTAYQAPPPGEAGTERHRDLALRLDELTQQLVSCFDMKTLTLGKKLRPPENWLEYDASLKMIGRSNQDEPLTPKCTLPFHWQWLAEPYSP